MESVKTILWVLVACAIVLNVAAVSVLVAGLLVLSRGVKAISDVAREAMENVVAAADLPAAMYVRDVREAKAAKTAIPPTKRKMDRKVRL